ncbi:hypothetical protein cym2001_35790 [Pseudomonas sp. CYM-20-01]|nr:hypothetical protein cym2001_35790 [Pseudomonas sp. CYM-20-01]
MITPLNHEQMLDLRQCLERGLPRRVGLVLNHRALGFVANAMLALDVPDALMDEVGNNIEFAEGTSH